MGTIMKTLDTGLPQVDRLVLAVLERDNNGVKLTYLSNEEKDKLVAKINEKK